MVSEKKLRKDFKKLAKQFKEMDEEIRKAQIVEQEVLNMTITI